MFIFLAQNNAMSNEELLDVDLTTENNLELRTADLSLRFLNNLIDTFAILGISVGVLVVFGSDSNSLAYLLYLAYYVAFEAATDRTIGKYITGTIVVKEDGSKPEFTDIFIRSISRFVPFEALSFFGKSGRGWHDKWSKTYVIKASEAPMV